MVAGLRLLLGTEPEQRPATAVLGSVGGLFAALRLACLRRGVRRRVRRYADEVGPVACLVASAASFSELWATRSPVAAGPRPAPTDPRRVGRETVTGPAGSCGSGWTEPGTGVAALLHVTHHRTVARLTAAQAQVRAAALTGGAS